MFKGCITALVTPFRKGKIDFKALEKLITWQIEQGINGLVLCGSTGEASTLTVDEKEEFIRTSLSIINKRVPAIIGTTSNATQTAIEYIKQAERLGSNGALIATAYYNKPTQEGIYRHFEAIRKQSKLPIVLYNIPGRSAVNMTDETIARIAKLKNIVGLKDSSCDLARPFSLQTYNLNSDFAMLSGEDITTVAFNASGGKGLISVSANIVPKQCAQIQALCAKGDYKSALKEHQKLVPLHLGLFCETNPIPLKYALHLLGFISAEMRLPLMELQNESKTRIKNILKSLKLL